MPRLPGGGASAAGTYMSLPLGGTNWLCSHACKAKSIAKGNHESEEVKEAFTSYAACLINSFKAEDRAAQLQEEFSGMVRKSRQTVRTGAVRDQERNSDALMMRVAHDDTMGGYVERKPIKRVPPKVPKIRPVNLRKKELGRKR